MYRNLSIGALGVSGTQNEVIEVALSHGFKGIDLDLAEFGRQVELNGLARSRRLLDSAKLRIGSFRLPIDWQGDDASFQQSLAAFGPLGEIAQQLGCQRAVTVIDPAHEERPYHQNFELHRQRLASLADALAPLGMRLGVGFLAPAPHRADKRFEFLHDLNSLLMLLGMVGRPNIGVALDVWHVYAAGGDVSALGGLSKEQVVTVSLADAPADADPATLTEDARLLPGAGGVIDAMAVLAMLAENGYDGPVTPAPHASQLSGKSRDQAVKTVAAALDAVWKGAGLSPTGKLTSGAK